MAPNLSILQWNINSYSARSANLHAIVQTRSIDIVMLQETLTGDTVRFSGYIPFVQASTEGTRGLITLVKATIPCSRVDNPLSCGEGVEVLAVEIQLAQGPLRLYNVYSRPACGNLDMSEVCASAEQDLVIIGGDFNAHHPIIAPTRRSDAAGRHIASVLESCPEIALLNDPEPTHVRGGVLDLTFATATLGERIRWSVDDTVTSDHYGVVYTISNAGPAPALQHKPRWKVERADWHAFQAVLARQLRCNEPPVNDDVDAVEANLVIAINQAAAEAIPKSRPWTRSHKDSWYYNDEIREANHRVNMARKNFRRRRSPENLTLLKEVERYARDTAKKVRQEKWLEWCESFGQQTSLTELWRRVKRATNRSLPRRTHHDPQAESERLALEFSVRTNSANLPAELRASQECLRHDRLALVRTKATEPANSDAAFSLRELTSSFQKSSRSAPGSDGILYPIISHLGLQGELALLRLINVSWSASTLPRSWKQADIVPIPKPREPGKYRPISLLSCLGKTAERMVLNRLQWVLGHPHENLHGFTRGMSTSHSIATLLSTVSCVSSVVIFLDLEKAFEMASPLAILESLSRKGVRGRLLAWIEAYFQNRVARVRFQGHHSRYLPLENGTPQGGVLSPALFNTLMSSLLELQLPVGSRIISYADDLAIISAGRGALTKAQHCLDLVTGECCRLGLKISAAKSKAMALRLDTHGTMLRVQGLDLTWVQAYQYLGVWIDQRLHFTKEVEYLTERVKARLTVMRALSGRHVGAGHQVLRAFYVHAIRPIVDYASVALIAAKPRLRDRLELLQNQAARTILGAPGWTKVINLRMEANLLPLDSRIDLIAAQFFAKVIQTPKDTYLRQKVLRRLEMDYELFANASWLSHTARVTIRFHLRQQLLAKGMDMPHPGYIPAPPWAQSVIEFSVMRLTGRKSQYPPPLLRAEVERFITELTPPGSITYFTDGSVDPISHTAGAGFVGDNAAVSLRVSDNASSLQAEAVAIMGALAHANLREGHVVIHTDSRAVIDSLQHVSPSDNIFLLTIVLALCQRILGRGRRVILNWVPSHIGIPGNERADQLADVGRGRPPEALVIHPSRELLRSRAAAAGRDAVKRLHREATGTSASARWYMDATGYQPLALTGTIPRGTEVILHRMRLGHPCAWQIIDTIGFEERCCSHCSAPEASLLHFLLECEHTRFLRQGPLTTATGLVMRLTTSLVPWQLERLRVIRPPQ